MQETCSIHGLGKSPRVGNGNPLQYSCLGDPMDRGVLQATVHGVTKSWTRLSTVVHEVRPRFHHLPHWCRCGPCICGPPGDFTVTPLMKKYGWPRTAWRSTWKHWRPQFCFYHLLWQDWPSDSQQNPWVIWQSDLCSSHMENRKTNSLPKALESGLPYSREQHYIIKLSSNQDRSNHCGESGNWRCLRNCLWKFSEVILRGVMEIRKLNHNMPGIPFDSTNKFHPLPPHKMDDPSDSCCLTMRMGTLRRC